MRPLHPVPTNGRPASVRVRASLVRAAAGLLALLLAGLVPLTAVGAGPRPTAGPPNREPLPGAAIDPALAAVLAAADPATPIAAIAILRDQVGPHDLGTGSGRPPARLLRTKRDLAASEQSGLLAILDLRRRQGAVERVTPLWIVNAISVTARPSVIRELARSPLVARIEPEVVLAAVKPTTTAGVASTVPVEPNVSQIGAPALWDLGYRGGGAVVASLDTGVDAGHPDLAATWRGGANSWYDPYGEHPTTPTDLNGHGTGVMGVVVGGSAGGTAIGVAPEARWIAAKIFNDAGVATTTAIHLAFQWVLDPDGDPTTADAPDVVNGSWAMGAPGCDLRFEPDLEALVAAGIVPVFAAGNFGPTSPSDASPANNPAAVAVGAVDGSDAVWSGSSRGPTSCGRTSPVTFPTVAAPGVEIWTAARFGQYTSLTGTSIAAAHVSGALALLAGAVPAADVASLEAALAAGAVDLAPAGPDNGSGAGRIDVLAAYRRLTGTPEPTPTPTPTPSATPAPTATPTPAPTPTATPGGDTSGPTTATPVLAPNPTTGETPVTLAATIDDTASGGSPIVAAEWFLDAAGPPGTGVPLVGPFGSPTVTATGTIPTATLAALADGAHLVLVRGRDAAGNWGPPASAVLVLDRQGPVVELAAPQPSRTDGAGTVVVTASAADPTGVGGGEAWIDTDPGLGRGVPFEAADGALGDPSETLRTSLATAGLSNGEHLVGARARDTLGTWGAAVVAPILVTPPDTLVADGFESGDLSTWTRVRGATRLAVVEALPAAGRFALAATLDPKTPAYVEAAVGPVDGFRARIALDPATAATGGRIVDVLAARSTTGKTLVAVQFRRGSGGPEVRLWLRTPTTILVGPWQTLGPGWHVVELAWQRGASAGATLWLDGGVAGTVSGVDTRTGSLGALRLGPSAGLGKGVGGILRIDRFVATRSSPIGG